METPVGTAGIGPTWGSAYSKDQIPLSLRFDYRRYWIALCEELQCKEATAAIAFAGYLTAMNSGLWTTYSAAKEHYHTRMVVPQSLEEDVTFVPREASKLYTYANVVGGIDHLAGEDLIEDWRQEPGVRNWQSAFRAKPELVDLVGRTIAKAGLPKPTRPAEVLQLRDKDGNPIALRENPQTRRWRRVAEELNEYLRDAPISSGSACIVRIFNRDWTRGGRFYCSNGGWMNLKKEHRRKILIDGEEVVELDYGTVHPWMVYSAIGMTPPKDSYDIDGWPRKLVKTAFLTCLNAENWNEAIRSIAGDAKSMKLLGLRRRTRESYNAAVRLTNAIRKVHKHVEHLFCRDMGAGFMLRDAAMAEMIMTRLMREGVTVLPIHDSFLVQRSRRHLLEGLMREAAILAGMGDMPIEEPS